MLNGLYGYLFGSEDDVSDNNTKENVAVLRNSTELVASTSPDEISETKDDDWILLDGQISGRSTPVFVPEPDLIAIDDDLSTMAASSVRSESPTPVVPSTEATTQNGHGYGEKRCESMVVKRLERTERMRQARQRAFERKELERQLFEDQVLMPSSEADKKLSNNINNSDSNNKTLNMLNSATKMKRSTAAGHFAAETKTKPRSKKTNRLLAGRNNDRKVNNLN